jgi:hypothetical protein
MEDSPKRGDEGHCRPKGALKYLSSDCCRAGSEFRKNTTSIFERLKGLWSLNKQSKKIKSSAGGGGVNLNLKKYPSPRITCKIGNLTRFWPDEEIKLQIERARRGDSWSFARYPVCLLPQIIQAARAAGLRGVDLLNMIGPVEKRLKKALAHFPAPGKNDRNSYGTLVKGLVKEELIKLKGGRGNPV